MIRRAKSKLWCSDTVPSRTDIQESVNSDVRVIENFGLEWERFDQADLDGREAAGYFARYFSLVDLDQLGTASTALDVGCGSGRWAAMLAPHVGSLTAVDASERAVDVARRMLAGFPHCSVLHTGIDQLPERADGYDLVYSLGVLHHVPDTKRAISACADVVRPGGTLLLYLYYRFDNKPRWFRALWRASDLARRGIARLPFTAKRLVCDAIAITTYWPLARVALVAEHVGRNVENLPLAFYRRASLYTMRTDALDRFGTTLEQRFTRLEITTMLRDVGLEEIRFADHEPYWCVTARQPLQSDENPDVRRAPSTPMPNGSP